LKKFTEEYKATPEFDQGALDRELYMASFYGFPECIRVLLQNGASIDYKSSTGQTPLMKAVGSGNTDAVRLLIDMGADSSIRSDGNLTALDIAKFISNSDCISILESSVRTYPGIEKDFSLRNFPSSEWRNQALIRLIVFDYFCTTQSKRLHGP